MKKIKISELPVVSSLIGLFTIGVDSQNRSVAVSLEFVQDAADAASTAAGNANTKADAAQEAASAANTAAQNASSKASEANTAAEGANAAKQAANAAAAQAVAAAGAADTSADNADRAADEADGAAQDATTAADAANTAAKATDTAREAIVALFESLIPSGLTVTAPQRITQGNLAELFIKAHLTPEGVAENVVFISDNRSVSVAPDGRVTVLGRGISTVHIVPTLKTALAKSIPVEVVAPACRLNTASSLRFTQAGGFRLT